MVTELQQPPVSEVRAYWQAHPLGTLEATAQPGSRAFFEWHDDVRWAEEGVFTEHLYEFDAHANERVLDIGCGIGWLVANFARGGAKVCGLDLTEAAISLTRQRLALQGLDAELVTGNAEQLPFPDNHFDYVTSAGVLHHTPDTAGAIREAIRVTKPGGRGMIALYYRHMLLGRTLWPLTRAAVRLLMKRTPGRDDFGRVETVDDLVRLYDGNRNPIGKAYSRPEIRALFAECSALEAVETHFFPTRFLIAGRAPFWLRRALDRLFGLIVYVQYRK